MKPEQLSKILPKETQRLVYLLLVVTLCLSLFPQNQVSAAGKCKFYYKVQAGDTIIGIGALYQYDWREIADANRLKEPYVLTPGDKLCIPGGVAPEVTTSETGTGKTVTAKVEPTGTVGGGYFNVYIKLEHFPKRTVYVVRLQPKTSPVFYKIGQIRTDDKGFFEDWLRIPLYIPYAPIHQLCLKDVWTDETACTDFKDPYYLYNKKFDPVPYNTHKYGH
jgi:hypothetical protein